MKSVITKSLSALGYSVVKTSGRVDAYGLPPDMDAGFRDIYRRCKPFTMTSAERMYSVYSSVSYVLRQGIAGDFVECGVWRGGSSMVTALTLLQAGVTDRTLYLYDTFEGMSEPTERDKDISGTNAQALLDKPTSDKTNSVWCLADLDDVKTNVLGTGYPADKVVFVKGKVEDTIPATVPERIALLRLDTDWYESTYHEFTHLYPLLERSGVLLIDDYGHWQGSREATDQYLKENGINLLLSRVDYTGRVAIKP